MIRIAAIGDVHVGLDDAGSMAPALRTLKEDADVLLIAGDLTRHGEPDEARVLAHELRDVDVPIVAVLGNHDYHGDRSDQITEALRAVGVIVLEQSSTSVEIGGASLDIVGAKGFCGGFAGACGSEFGEPEMKSFIRHTRETSERLERLLAASTADRVVVLLHYSPVAATCVGERREIFPFLGSYLLGEAIDRSGADLVLHGHAHHGSERGVTPGGVPVRNVARPLVGVAWQRFDLSTPSERTQDSSRNSGQPAPGAMPV